MRDLKLENIARRAVRHELMMGRMVRPETCTECGKNPGFAKDGRSLIQAHHYNGHENKLDIIWLCVQCHRDASPRANGEKNGWYARPEARSVTTKGGQALSDEQVMEAYTSKEPRAVLAKRLGVNECVIHDITAGRHYGHLTGGKSRTQLKLEAAYAQGKADGRAEAIKELAAPIWPPQEPQTNDEMFSHDPNWLEPTALAKHWKAAPWGTMCERDINILVGAVLAQEPPATVDAKATEGLAAWLVKQGFVSKYPSALHLAEAALQDIPGLQPSPAKAATVTEEEVFAAIDARIDSAPSDGINAEGVFNAHVSDCQKSYIKGMRSARLAVLSLINGRA